jgi:4-hydroxy-tetrahydrodipicolinate synthase
MALRGPLEGTLTALYTPMTAAGELDLPAFTRLAERLVAAGSGLVPCGTTGETPTLSVDEYRVLVSRAVEVARGRVPVIAGTGSSATRQTVEMTELAKGLGCDAALVVNPPYNKPPQVSLLAHFRAVADVGLPVLLYNVPSRTGSNIAAQTALTLAEDRRFIGIKEAGGSLAQVEQLVAGAPEGFAVLSGDDGWTLPMMALGARGVVSVASNVAPEAVVRMVRAALSGDFAAARAEHYRLRPLFEALFLTTNPILVKRAAALLGHSEGHVRLPLTVDAIEPKFETALVAAMRQAGLELVPGGVR